MNYKEKSACSGGRFLQVLLVLLEMTFISAFYFVQVILDIAMKHSLWEISSPSAKCSQTDYCKKISHVRYPVL